MVFWVRSGQRLVLELEAEQKEEKVWLLHSVVQTMFGAQSYRVESYRHRAGGESLAFSPLIDCENVFASESVTVIAKATSGVQVPVRMSAIDAAIVLRPSDAVLRAKQIADDGLGAQVKASFVWTSLWTSIR